MDPAGSLPSGGGGVGRSRRFDRRGQYFRGPVPPRQSAAQVETKALNEAGLPPAALELELTGVHSHGKCRCRRTYPGSPGPAGYQACHRRLRHGIFEPAYLQTFFGSIVSRSTAPSCATSPAIPRMRPSSGRRHPDNGDSRTLAEGVEDVATRFPDCLRLPAKEGFLRPAAAGGRIFQTSLVAGGQSRNSRPVS